MLLKGAQTRLALMLSVGLHLVVFAFGMNAAHWFADKTPAPKVEQKIVLMQLLPLPDKRISAPVNPKIELNPPKLTKPFKSNPAAITSSV